jgi:formate-dependent nitrite reductase membrane component NrfD
VITEQRLDQLRRDAQPMKPERGYYGLPYLKDPVWSWEVPTYFFVGGAAGAAAVIGAAAQLSGADRDLIGDARWIAAAGAALSVPLLISDLGRPERFLNMLRVFKVQSPMSVGSWALAAFGTFSAAAVFADEVRKRTNLPVTLIGDAAGMLAGATGLVMSTYTGVLIGATSIPVWAKHASLLPIHFGASALSSAASMLELLGHTEDALNFLGLAASLTESYISYKSSLPPTITSLAASAFSGPLPALMRVVGFGSQRFRQAAAASTLIGSLLTRISWIEAGKKSASGSGHAAGPREAIGE